jgi:hypothetical protein
VTQPQIKHKVAPSANKKTNFEIVAAEDLGGETVVLVAHYVLLVLFWLLAQQAIRVQLRISTLFTGWIVTRKHANLTYL